MSSPFIYSPHSSYFQPFPPPSGYFPRTYQQQVSPFLPTEAIYPSSPYLDPLRSHEAPNTPMYSGPRRRRHLSWSGGSTPRISPFIPPSLLPAYLDHQPAAQNVWGSTAWYPQAPPYTAPPFSAPPQTFSASSYVSGYPQFPGSLQIHPWLNGDAPSQEFVFDMSITAFDPRRFVGPGQQPVPLSIADYQAPAFFPPITKLRIICDMIPNRPIDLVFGAGGYGGAPPPITLGDVLVAIHRKMHQRITHQDWERLSMSEEARVSRAFIQRCRIESMRHEGGFRSDSDLPERQQGVKVVDFLLGRYMFKGLTRSEDGYVRMNVA
ncbi:hypothetical protein B0H15DRAFT_820654 [Mycena belliarum]|uniref:DUF6699 domain-containing protein n=1 Tax=Mycena belliarum TaxID=1033014 RepID=A0AAD6UDD0_9AGAR|nr:hypothetical protein B0H15DRAFT_820654 [Mycena belliae]